MKKILVHYYKQMIFKEKDINNNFIFLKKYYNKDIKLYYKKYDNFPYSIRETLSHICTSRKMTIVSSKNVKNILINLFFNEVKNNNILFITFNYLSCLKWKYDLMQIWNKKTGIVVNLNLRNKTLFTYDFNLTKIFLCTSDSLFRKIKKNNYDIFTHYTLFYLNWKYIVIDIINTNLINEYMKFLDKFPYKINIILSSAVEVDLNLLKMHFGIKLFFISPIGYQSLKRKYLYNQMIFKPPLKQSSMLLNIKVIK
mmetsp:Transcript_11268/g.21605  ORF Transcript_11268/g.21605 Transcript_11268/m.21605 type:complete len:254 (-) Transcript_11268:4-765(-)